MAQRLQRRLGVAPPQAEPCGEDPDVRPRDLLRAAASRVAILRNRSSRASARPRWKSTSALADYYVSIASAADGTLYPAGSAENSQVFPVLFWPFLTACDPATGSARWRVEAPSLTAPATNYGQAPGPTWGFPPAVSPDGTVYVGTEGGKVVPVH